MHAAFVALMLSSAVAPADDAGGRASAPGGLKEDPAAAARVAAAAKDARLLKMYLGELARERRRLEGLAWLAGLPPERLPARELEKYVKLKGQVQSFGGQPPAWPGVSPAAEKDMRNSVQRMWANELMRNRMKQRGRGR
jgi:hypothetical protein